MAHTVPLHRPIIVLKTGQLIATLLAESLQSFLDKSGKRFLPLPDLSRKIEGDSVRRVVDSQSDLRILLYTVVMNKSKIVVL